MLSVSDLLAYNFCKRKLWLAKVKKLKEPPSKAMTLGSIRHKAIEMIHEAEARIISNLESIPSKDELKQLCTLTHSSILRQVINEELDRLEFFEVSASELYEETFPYIKDETHHQFDRIHTAITSHKVVGKPLLDLIQPKIQTEVQVKSENLGISGRIDRLEIYDHAYIPVEIKTGKSSRQGPWDDHILQVVAYCMVLEDMYRMPVNKARIIYYNPRIVHEVTANAFSRFKVMELKEKVAHLLQQSSPPDFCNSQNKCNICGLKDACFGL